MPAADSKGTGNAKRGLDAYEVRARLVPAIGSVLALIPAIVLGFGVGGGWVTAVLSASVPVVVAVLAASLAREAGVRLQERLWGPERVSAVVELLQWRNGTSRSETASRHRTVLETTGITLPTAEAEQIDPREADGHYRAAETAMRRRAAGGDHPALSRALTQYGLVRNFAGLRILCVVSSAAAIAIGLWVAVFDDRVIVGLAIMAFAALYVAVVLWLIDDGAVRRAGDSYARSLFDACAAGVEHGPGPS